MDNNPIILEWQNTIQKIASENSSIKELDYFFNIAKDYIEGQGESNNSKKVVMIRVAFPDEIIRAMGIELRYVFKGSCESTLIKSVNLPKDVDDGTRSLIGNLQSEISKLSKDDVLLVPIYNDNEKQLKTLFGDLTNVIFYEVPFNDEDLLQREIYVDETYRVTKDLQKRFKKRLSNKKLREECKISNLAAEVFCKLESLYKGKTIALSATAFVFIVNSYYMCRNRVEWISHVEKLIEELSAKNDTPLKEYPNVLLFGSPIYAPNYKVLFAIEDVHLRISAIIHPDIERIKIAKDVDIKSVSIKNLAITYLNSYNSPSFINNSKIMNLVLNNLGDGKIKGVVAHIVRGQIVSDYERKCVERLIAEYKIPIINIETVYNYQDIDQINLRLEAFSEIIN